MRNCESVVTLALREAAQNALDETNGDLRQAHDLLAGWVRGDPEFYRTVIVPIIDDVLDLALTAVALASPPVPPSVPPRAARPASTPRAATTAGLHALARHNARLLLEYPLGNGIKLGDATRVVVAGEAELRSTTARELVVEARWLTAIAARLPDDTRRVREVLVEHDLVELHHMAARPPHIQAGDE